MPRLDWLAAATVAERLRPLSKGPLRGHTFDDVTTWPWRARKWLSETPFSSANLLSEHLRTSGIDRDAFIAACETNPKDWVEDPRIPDWADSLEGYVAGAESMLEGSQYRPKGFAAASAPLLQSVLEDLRSTISSMRREFPHVPMDPDRLESMLLDQLISTQVLPRITRCMILELHVEKTDQLDGESGEARFRQFIEAFERSSARQARFLRDYPLLARDLLQSAQNWVQFTQEILGRWCADYDEIGQVLLAQPPGAITSIQLGVGDIHRKGRSVAVLQTEARSRIVYKPRSVDSEEHYSELLDWLNSRGITPPFYAPRVIAKDGYGWWEYFQQQSCKSQHEVKRFYRRLGGHLAVLHALDGVDMHLENIVASGEHPVIVDLEGLFQPRTENTSLEGAVDRLAWGVLAQTVMRVGLLPHTSESVGDGKSYEISGVGGKPGQVAPHSILQYEAPATDEMVAVLKPQVIEGSQNRPRLKGNDIDPVDFRDAIAAGFESTYRLLARNKTSLLDSAGPVERFKSDEVRAILRPTRAYANLLVSSSHPDFLQNAIDRDRLFDRLWDGFPYSESKAEQIRAEKADLFNGDIPIFSARPSSRSVWSSTGEEIANFFPQTALEVVRKRIGALDSTDLRRQLWYVRASLATLAVGRPARTSVDAGMHRRLVPKHATRSFLDEAVHIGNRLVSLALHEGSAATWVGLTLRQEGTWSVGPVSANLYSGSAGIALFLAYLGTVTGGDRFTSLARRAIAPLVRDLDASEYRAAQLRSSSLPLGGIEGLGGYIYALVHFGTLWDEPAYLQLAERLAGFVNELAPTDEALDVLGGSAGNLLALLALYGIRPSVPVFAAATACAERLVATATEFDAGIGWNTRIKSVRPLLGFAHGASGIALALVRFGHLSGDARFADFGMRALEYERAEISRYAGVWPDHREWSQHSQQDIAKGMCAWCHGAAGGALARLGIFRIAPSKKVLIDLKNALRVVEEYGFDGNYSLCHGSLGNLEVINEASVQKSLTRLNANTVASSLLRRRGRGFWQCGVPLGVETPDLMTGIAGIGYALLRFASKRPLPSLLLLDQPEL